MGEIHRREGGEDDTYSIVLGECAAAFDGWWRRVSTLLKRRALLSKHIVYHVEIRVQPSPYPSKGLSFYNKRGTLITCGSWYLTCGTISGDIQAQALSRGLWPPNSLQTASEVNLFCICNCIEALMLLESISVLHHRAIGGL